MPTIEFHYEDNFELDNVDTFLSWIKRVVNSENYKVGDINYIFSNDTYLGRIHEQFMNNKELTDIITFDYVEGNVVSGDIFISIERVMENAGIYRVEFYNELLRVMSHGLLHLMGYKDKSKEDSLLMRNKENEKIGMFHVEQ